MLTSTRHQAIRWNMVKCSLVYEFQLKSSVGGRNSVHGTADLDFATDTAEVLAAAFVGAAFAVSVWALGTTAVGRAWGFCIVMTSSL